MSRLSKIPRLLWTEPVLSAQIKSLLKLSGCECIWGHAANSWLVFLAGLMEIRSGGFQLVSPEAEYHDWVVAIQRLLGT